MDQKQQGGERADRSVTKIDSRFSPRGKMGQKYLAAGIELDMRLWEDVQPGQDKPPRRRPYETVGYVIRGKAELHLEGNVVLLEPGDSWVVPRDAEHTYKVLEPFTAVEASHPPAFVHGRDEE
jgi:quercetin dioxygenase-like cupin family protein